MTETPDPGHPLGVLLESARTNGLQISGREAARRAGMSPTRWRQVVAGARAGARVVIAMALAVDVDPAEALQAAKLVVPEPSTLAALVEDIRRGAGAREPEGDDAMATEIERISSLPISASARQRMIKALIDVYAEAANEARPAPKTA